MIVGSVCLSHSPLRISNPPPDEVGARFDNALREVADFVTELDPDLLVVFHPDHMNGFFYKMLPPFCIGIEATSVGDYGTKPGKLNVPAALAEGLAAYVIDQGVDASISYDMEIDHGAVQPVEWLSDVLASLPIIPVFINCAAPPRPNFARVRALGKAVGDWARRSENRILVVGSGGLSHDPPMASLASATPEIRRRIVNGQPLTQSERMGRQNRAVAEGRAMAEGRSSLRAVNPEWDRSILDALIARDLTVLDGSSDCDITNDGGRGGHEVRTWVSAMAALQPDYVAQVRFYEPINAWITGMGIMTAVER